MASPQLVWNHQLLQDFYHERKASTALSYDFIFHQPGVQDQVMRISKDKKSGKMIEVVFTEEEDKKPGIHSMGPNAKHTSANALLQELGNGVWWLLLPSLGANAN